MAPYFIVFFTLASFHFIEFFKNKKNLKYIMYLIATLILVLFAGLRHVGTGTDDYNYFIFFNEIPTFTDAMLKNNFSLNSYHKEYGYIILNLLIKDLTDNYIYLFMSIAFLSVGINSYNYKKYSVFIFLTLLLYFVHTYLYRDLNQIRAGVAAAIGLFTIPYIYKKDFLRFFIIVLFGSLFHIAILSLFLVYIINFININRNKAIIIFFVSVLFGLIGISSILISFLPPELGTIAKSLNNYANSITYSKDLGMFNITNIKSLFIFIFLLIFYDKLKEKVKYFDTLFIFYLLAVSWRFAFSDFAILSGRIATFFEIVEVILLPSFLLIFRQKFFISVLIILYAYLVLYLNLYTTGRQPYEVSIF